MAATEDALTAVLEAVHSPCAVTRGAAEAALAAMERDDLAQLLLNLVRHLALEVRARSSSPAPARCLWVLGMGMRLGATPLYHRVASGWTSGAVGGRRRHLTAAELTHRRDLLRLGFEAHAVRWTTGSVARASRKQGGGFERRRASRRLHHAAL